MMNTDNTHSEISGTIIPDHTNQRHPRSIPNWKYYYITLAVWLLVLIGLFYGLSVAFS
jgi:hypothetical protein